MEGIGLALDLKGGRMFFTDFGGSVYSANLDGSEQKDFARRRGQPHRHCIRRGACRLLAKALALAVPFDAKGPGISEVLPNAPVYPVLAYAITPQTYVWAALASPLIGLWSVGFVRAIAWADRVRPPDWRRLVAPPLVFLAIGLLSIRFPELLGNAQDLAQVLFRQPLLPLAVLVLLPSRPLATVASVASGAPAAFSHPRSPRERLLEGALGMLRLQIFPGGDVGLFALLGAGAMLSATMQGPISSLF